MSELDEQYEDSSDYTESPPPEQSARSPRDTSGSPTGNALQRLLNQAVGSSEYREDYLPGGIPVRRPGRQLHVSYDNAMNLLWGDDDSYNV